MPHFKFVISLISLVFLASCNSNQLADSAANTDFGADDQYIVVYKPESGGGASFFSSGLSASAVVKANSVRISEKYSVQVKRDFSRVLRASVFKMTRAQAAEVASDSAVAYVEKDVVISINVAQSDPPWGLDRIDQATNVLDQSYKVTEGNTQVRAYVIDTGIRISHEEFEGRAEHGYDAVDNDSDATDCNGHGTHVAGSIGGKTYGVAKKVKLVGIRVLDCRGSGRISDVIEGVEWVTNNHIKPALANMSLGGGVSQALDDSVESSIASGISYVVAAGNDSIDACGGSPSRVDGAITVGASDIDDRRSSFSNYGTCVDIFAPGSNIKSASYRSDSATENLNGTSMASPHVAGAIAIYLSQQPGAGVAEVTSQIVGGALDQVITDTGTGSPNKLLNTSFMIGDDSGGGGDEPGSELVGLNPGDEIDGISGVADSVKEYKIDIPEGVRNFRVSVSGGSGDVDLYTSLGTAPSLSSYDCRPYLAGNDESCISEEPDSGTLYINLVGYSFYSDVSLKVNYEADKTPIAPPSLDDIVAPCFSCEYSDGVHGGTGAYSYHPDGRYFYVPRTIRIQIYLRSIGDNNFDMELYRWSGVRWEIVARGLGSSNEKDIRQFVSQGYYIIRSVSKRGSGEYRVYIDK